MLNKDFMFGVSTSAFQIEGDDGTQGRGLSVWDTFCDIPGKIYAGHHGRLGVDHYNRYREDVGLLSDLGVDSYRFSVSWPRILPEGTGKINEKGLDFYDRLIDELLEKNIKPFLTLYHWDLPERLGEKGGFRNPDFPEWFADYTEILLKRYSDRVKHYITYNEPLCAVHASYHAGVFAPGLQLNVEQSMVALHHFLLGHGRAANLIRDYRKDSEVGIAMSVWDYYPKYNNPECIENARKAFFCKDTPTESIDMYMDPVYLGKYPDRFYEMFPRVADRITDEEMKIIGSGTNILCVNNYTGEPLDQNGKKIPPEIGAPKSPVYSYYDPNGLYWDVRFLAERYKLPVYITENGSASEDIVSLDGKVHDPNRVDYLKRNLAMMEKIIEDGIDLRGYFVWSLTDNFEWLSGYSVRFGLVHVDYGTMKRTPKDSFEFYKNYIKDFKDR